MNSCSQSCGPARQTYLIKHCIQALVIIDVCLLNRIPDRALISQTGGTSSLQLDISTSHLKDTTSQGQSKTANRSQAGGQKDKQAGRQAFQHQLISCETLLCCPTCGHMQQCSCTSIYCSPLTLTIKLW
jgi:hypothetical protein